MQKTIINKLRDIEQQQQVKILFAVESGSRGWQFPSTDSDYDVRFIYVRPFNYYLSVIDRRYDLNFPISEDLDIYGWDIRKVLQLMLKSNATPFEWLQSPVVYHQLPGFQEQLWALCAHYFSQRANIHHYLGIAKGALDTIVEEGEIKVKKLFYVLRPLLAAKWCLERRSIAPMTIGPLMQSMPDSLLEEMHQLITLKAGWPESFVINISNELKTYIEQQMSVVDGAAKPLPRDHFTVDRLNDFFVRTIKNYDD